MLQARRKPKFLDELRAKESEKAQTRILIEEFIASKNEKDDFIGTVKEVQEELEAKLGLTAS